MLDLALILGTPRGIEMLTKMDGYEVDIVLGDFGMAYVNDGVIAIDPDFHPITETTGGLIRASTLRVLAHELGHKIMGDLDDGLKHLNNTKRNENPIMNNLGEPARTRYECPKKGCY